MSGHQSGGVVLTEAELTRLAELEAGATAGPWSSRREDGEDLHFGRMTFTYLDAPQRNLFAVAGMSPQDAEFIAALRNVAPELLRLAAQAGRVAEVVEKVLGEHRIAEYRGPWDCTCHQWRWDHLLSGSLVSQHRAHVAARVAAELEADQ